MVALACAAAALASALAVGWPRGPRRTSRPELPRPLSRAGGDRAAAEHLRAALEEAGERHLAAALAAGAAGKTEESATVTARARAAGLAAELVERWRRSSASPAAPELERFALLSSVLAVLHEPRLPEERAVAGELRVRWLELLFDRATRSEGRAAAPEARAPLSSNGVDASPRPAPLGELRIEKRSDGGTRIAARSAAPAALLQALLAELELAVEPLPERTGPARLEVYAERADIPALTRDLAGTLGLLGPLESALEARQRKGRWQPWEAALPAADREALLHLVLAHALAAETEPLGEAARCEARFLRARVQEELGALPAALEEYTALVAAHPQRERAIEALSRCARIHVARGQLDLAQAAWEQLIERHPEAPDAAEALLLSADLCAARGLAAAARQRYERILQGSSPPSVAAAARLGRLAIRFSTELERASPRQLQQLAAALAREADARREPELRARYLALSAELFRRIGATPLALREALAASEEARDLASRERSALAASELALALRAPLAALWSLDRCGLGEAPRATVLRASARELLGWNDLPPPWVTPRSPAEERSEPGRAPREPALARDLEQSLSILRARCAALETPR